MILLIWCTLFGLSCPAKPQYFHGQLPYVETVRYWIDPSDRRLSWPKIEVGAALLGKMGFKLVHTYDRADARILVQSEDCSDAPTRVARTSACGRITFCTQRFGTKYDAPWAYSHELSHAVGSGHATGIALMAPTEDGSVTDFTEVDAAYFPGHTGPQSKEATYYNAPFGCR